MLITLFFSAAACLIILSLCLAIGHSLLKMMGLLEYSNRSTSQFMFDLSLQYVMGYGTLGLISLYAYFLNIPRSILNMTILVTFVLCCAGASKSKYQYRLFEMTMKMLSKARSINKMSLLKFYYVMGVLYVIIYVPRIFIPWLDHDEMAVYGFSAKLIGNGWSFQDLFVSRPMLVEALDGRILYLTGSTLAVRMIRLMNLIWLGLALFTFLRSVGVAKPYCAAAFCGLLSIPELSVLTTSLKVDSTVMMFEALGILALTQSFLANNDTSGLRWSGLGVAFSSFSVASRMSSLYLLALCILRFLYVIYKNWNIRNRSMGKRIAPFALVFISAISYMINWIIYDNPLHPFSTLLFESRFNGDSLNIWRGRYNLDLPSPLLQLYLIPHLALGWEVRWSWLENLLGFSFVHASDRVSMTWLSPALLGIFFAPMYLSVGVIRILAFEFIFLFILWSFGIHYSRVFLAASLIPVLICVIIMSRDWPGSRAKAYIARGVGYGFLLMTLLLPFYHVVQLIGFRRYIVLPDRQAIFDSNKRRLDNYNNQGDYVNLGRRDVEKIDKILEASRRPVIVAATSIGRSLHILFRDGLFVDVPYCSEPWQSKSEAQIRNCLYSFEASHVLVKRDSTIFAFAPKVRDVFVNDFPFVQYVSDEGTWELRAKNR